MEMTAKYRNVHFWNYPNDFKEQGTVFIKRYGVWIREQLPEHIKISYEVPQNMWGWTDTRMLQSIQLYKNKKQCIEGANEYLTNLQNL